MANTLSFWENARFYSVTKNGPTFTSPYDGRKCYVYEGDYGLLMGSDSGSEMELGVEPSALVIIDAFLLFVAQSRLGIFSAPGLLKMAPNENSLYQFAMDFGLPEESLYQFTKDSGMPTNTPALDLALRCPSMEMAMAVLVVCSM